MSIKLRPDLKENIASLVNKDNLIKLGNKYLEQRQGQLIQDFQSAKTDVIVKLTADVKDLGKQIFEAEKNEQTALNKLEKNKTLTEGEKIQRRQEIQTAYNEEYKIIEKNIELKKQEIINLGKAYLPIELKTFLNRKKIKEDTINSAKNWWKNGRKYDTSFGNVVSKISLVANFLINFISIGNKKIENLVDDILEFIENIKTQEDILKAKLRVDNAKRLINDNRIKLQNLQQVIDVITFLIPILEGLLRAFKIIPVPNLYTTVGITNKASSLDRKIEEIKNALSSILSIISRIIGKLIEDLDYQESRLKFAESLLNSDVANLNPSELSDLLSSNNTGFLNPVSTTGTGIGTGTSTGIGNGTGTGIDNQSSLSNGLGYLAGYDYKGFRFFIKEEQNPKNTVKGNKRRYAVALNKIGNEVLQSDYSFTLAPDVLVEQLKLEIDTKNLVA